MVAGFNACLKFFVWVLFGGDLVWFVLGFIWPHGWLFAFLLVVWLCLPLYFGILCCWVLGNLLLLLTVCFGLTCLCCI